MDKFQDFLENLCSMGWLGLSPDRVGKNLCFKGCCNVILRQQPWCDDAIFVKRSKFFSPMPKIEKIEKKRKNSKSLEPTVVTSKWHYRSAWNTNFWKLGPGPPTPILLKSTLYFSRYLPPLK